MRTVHAGWITVFLFVGRLFGHNLPIEPPLTGPASFYLPLNCFIESVHAFLADDDPDSHQTVLQLKNP